MIAAGVHADTAAGRRRKAVAIYGLMVGTLQLARAVTDRKLSDEILRSGAEQAIVLVREDGA
ncbi:MAG: hypothetical protein WDN50_16110 [Bradyrhizobium sp.]